MAEPFAFNIQHPCPAIPQGLVDKVLARRGGRLHMYPSIEGPRTALVVIDLDEHSMRRSSCSDWLGGAVNLVASAVRAAGGTVAYVTTRFAGLEAAAAALGTELAGEYYAAAASGADRRLAAELQVQPEDLHAVKARASAFFPGNCDLPDQLSARNVEHILIAGLATSVCCESSARDAHELGYKVTLVSDALAGQSFGVHEASLSVWFRNFGDVRPSHQVVDLLSRDT